MSIDNGKLMVGVGICFILIGATLLMFGESAGAARWLAMLCGWLNVTAGAFAFGLAYTRPGGSGNDKETS